jgi:hypothetical protein
MIRKSLRGGYLMKRVIETLTVILIVIIMLLEIVVVVIIEPVVI